MKKSLSSHRAFFAVVVAFVIFMAGNVPLAHADFSGGSGTSGDPYQITTCTDFENISTATSSDFILKNDIDCSSDENSIMVSGFSGTFDGGGHKITVAIETNSGDAALFLSPGTTTIEDLWIAGSVEIDENSSNPSLGGLVDSFTAGTISNVKSTVTLAASSSFAVGGIVGDMEGGTIENSYYDGTINFVTGYVGGIAGIVNGGTVQYVYAAGSVGGGGDNGGIAGQINNHGTIVEDSFSSASVTESGESLIGGVAGLLQYENLLSDDFWDVNASGQSSCSFENTPSGCTAENTDGSAPDYFEDNSTNGPFTSWDFTNTWKTVSSGYPELAIFSNATLSSASTVKGVTLASLGTPGTTVAGIGSAGAVTLTSVEGADTSNAGSYITYLVPTNGGATVTRIVKYATGVTDTNFATDTVYDGTDAVDNGDYFIIEITSADGTTTSYYQIVATVTAPPFSGGSGISGDPYQITTCADFENISTATSSHFILENDLDCTSDGNAIMVSSFGGTFDGGGHEITVAINVSSGNAALFLGPNGTIKNVWVAGTVADSSSSGESFVGGLASSISGGTILNVKSTVSVTEGDEYVGGIVGVLYSGTIENSYFNGTINITGSSLGIGGIVGAMSGGTLQYTYAAGSVEGSSNRAGGLIGQAGGVDESLSIEDSFSTASVSGGTHVGGLFGNEDGATLSNDFWDVTASGQADCVSGDSSVTGCTAENTDGDSPDYFEDNSSNGPFSAWNFTDTWETASASYPLLQVIQNVSAPTVVSVTPSNGATGQATNVAAAVTFSEPMDPTSVDIEVTSCGGDDCPLALGWLDDNTELSFIHQPGDYPDGTYTVTISSAKSTDEVSMAAPYSWSFTVSPPPTVVSVTPTDGSTDQSTSVPLVITFSEPMDTSSLVISTGPCSGTCPEYDTKWSDSNTVATLTKTGSPFASNTQYTISVVTAHSADEVDIGSTYSWSFTTASPVPTQTPAPTVTFLIPNTPPVIQPPTSSSSSGVTIGCTSGNLFSSVTSQACPVTTPNSPLSSNDVSSSFQPFLKNLRKGMDDPDVARLQAYLDMHNFPVATTGWGSLNQTATVFGAKTITALKLFQTSINLPSTGYFGPMTRGWVNTH